MEGWGNRVSNGKQKKDLLGKLVARLETAAPYADALSIENRTCRLMRDKSDTDFFASGDSGVKLRAFDGEKFHEACVQGWQPALLHAETQRLLSRLKEHPAQGKPLALKVGRETIDKEFSVHAKVDHARVPIGEKAQLLARLQRRILADGAFVNCQVSYREEEEQRVFVSRHRRLSSTWSGCTVALSPFAMSAQGQARSDSFMRFANGFEVASIDDAELSAFLARTARLKDAARIAPGAYTAVLSPQVSGLLAHESFGHGMEADMIMRGRAKASEFLGKRIAGAKVSICEDATIAGTHGFLFFDDEGMLPQRVYLVERGMVREPITDLLSASRAGFSRTANGRAEAFDHKVYARMTNTFFLSGKDDPKDMIKGVKDGVYIHSGSSGIEDPRGWGVQIAGLVCERIRKGKLTGELYYEASLGGYLPDILAGISAVGKDFDVAKDVGFCGKNHKEWVRVASGGPHLLVDKVELS